MTYDVYLSSTLNHLKEEREQIKQALTAAGISFKESYSASESSLIESCIDDVSKCRVYIGVVGGRYGYCPPNPDGSPGTKSITELEFLAAGRSGLPRYVFMKTESAIPLALHDIRTKENEAGKRIDAFRSMLANGSVVRCAEFDDVPKLREDVLVAVLKAVRSGAVQPLLASARAPHRRELTAYVAVVTAGRGVSDEERALHDAAAAMAGSRQVRIVSLDPSAPDYLSLLDDQCRNARAVAWHLDSRSWPIWRERSDLLARAIEIQVYRRGAAAVICSDQAASADLPGEWTAALRVDHEAGDLWETTMDGLFLALRPDVSSFRSTQSIALPVIVAAATSNELASAVAA